MKLQKYKEINHKEPRKLSRLWRCTPVIIVLWSKWQEDNKLKVAQAAKQV
jgi:hypothetical protein